MSARPTISLCMIARNEAEYLEECLSSARPLVDRLILVDTGSTDGTQEIAARFGAEVYSLPWQDDFAMARNFSLSHAGTDWILVLDADERLDNQSIDRLREASANPNIEACLLNIRNYFYQPNQALWDEVCVDAGSIYSERYPARYYCIHRNVRFFRNHGRFTYAGRLHERLVQRGGLALDSLTGVEATIHHFGFLKSRVSGNVKDQLYVRIARQQCAEDPRNPENFLILGMELLQRQGPSQQCLDAFWQCRELAPGEARAWTFAGIVLQRLGRYLEAEEQFALAAQLTPEQPLLWEERGDNFFNMGEHTASWFCYERADALYPTPRLSLKRAILAGKLQLPILPMLRQVIERLPRLETGPRFDPAPVQHLLQSLWPEGDTEANSRIQESLCRILLQLAGEQGRIDLQRAFQLLSPSPSRLAC